MNIEIDNIPKLKAVLRGKFTAINSYTKKK